MSQETLTIDLGKTLHLEIDCNKCKTSSILPLEDPPGIFSRLERPPASYQCPSCQRQFTEVVGIQAAVDAIRQGISFYRTVQGEFAIRLVMKK